ncbi:hypothetical protein [Nocardioides sp. 616]|uniref:hypothetical protein n=1 Tax=Nocardioides sp. 616 TaxID=2268090 RepID=UPI001F0582C5|nr:hypothetical protein [Nocardioides sp. 616]
MDNKPRAVLVDSIEQVLDPFNETRFIQINERQLYRMVMGNENSDAVWRVVLKTLSKSFHVARLYPTVLVLVPFGSCHTPESPRIQGNYRIPVDIDACEIVRKVLQALLRAPSWKRRLQFFQMAFGVVAVLRPAIVVMVACCRDQLSAERISQGTEAAPYLRKCGGISAIGEVPWADNGID